MNITFLLTAFFVGLLLGLIAGILIGVLTVISEIKKGKSKMASFDKLKKSEAKCISKKGKEAAFFVPQSAGRAEAVIKMELTDAQAKKVSVDKIYPFENGQVQI